MTAPLNIWSRSDEEIGRLMSNFAHTPFVLDGVEFASVEAFYAYLLQPSEATRERVRTMWGVRAKHEIPRVKPDTIRYREEHFALGSEQHLALIKRAIRAKLEAHPEIAAAFVATRPRPLIHETGYPDKPDAEFPRGTFCRILEELREETASAGSLDRRRSSEPELYRVLE
jgi:predicted NAD-dependent protein-ADP-ribosyltransferase YbiA (DUF1768 family)